MVLSTLAALASAAMFAVTTNLQRVAASDVPAEGSGPMHLVRRLVADPRWLLGGVIGLVALGLHAVALARGSVMVVQSVMALGLVMALNVEALRERRRLSAHELLGAALVTTGVVTVVAVCRPAEPGAAAGGWVLAFCATVVLGSLLAVGRSRRAVVSRSRARMLAGAAGACFAVDAVFLQRVAARFDPGVWAGVGSVDLLRAAAELGGFLVASFVGGVAVHRAYQVAPLRSVQPALAAAEPVTAFLLGVTVLHEGVRGGVLGFPILVAGLMAITAGIFAGLRPERADRPLRPPSAPRPLVAAPSLVGATASALQPASGGTTC
jgi:drug/metabolite transporter (DMT)-like permease